MSLQDTLVELGGNKVEPYDKVNEDTLNKDVSDNKTSLNTSLSPTEKMTGDLSELKKIIESGKEIPPELKDKYNGQIEELTKAVLSSNGNVNGKDNIDMLKDLSKNGFDSAKEALSKLEENGVKTDEMVGQPAILSKENEKESQNNQPDNSRFIPLAEVVAARRGKGA